MDEKKEMWKEHYLANGKDLLPDNFPELGNLSSAFIFQFLPKPSETKPPEFAYVPVDRKRDWGKDESVRIDVMISEWNIAWESGHLRSEFIPQVMGEDFPHTLKWLSEIDKANIYLIPRYGESSLEAFVPLYQLLPVRTLERFNLPLFRTGLWPASFDHFRSTYLPVNIEEQIAKAFACHVWPLVNTQSKIQAFSKDDPIVLLSHNLNYWLPHIYKVIENRLRQMPRVEFDDEGQEEKLHRLRKEIPESVSLNRPLCGGVIWQGEDDAWEATKEMVEIADKQGRLRAIIDAVKSSHVEDDFSNIWSFAKEDFERKLHHKRAKVRVSFVELDRIIPVHAPTSELHDNLLWEDFIALLDVKERRIIICIKNGATRLAEISKHLGYANHSPISKALNRIRKKAMKYLGTEH